MKCDVLIVGGGPAGMAAANSCANEGLSVILVEQSDRVGGAIFKQPSKGANAVPMPARQKRAWTALADAFERSGTRTLLRHSFLGLDSNGIALVEDRSAGKILDLKPKAVIYAIGALERVRPFPGWQLPGVMTAGGLQVMMKATGTAPAGRIILAGSGPLLVAVAAQMTALGNPPLAILERSAQAMSPLRALELLAAPHYLLEASGYLQTLLRAGVPWRQKTSIRHIGSLPSGGLMVTLRNAAGEEERLEVDRVGLHDGLRSNATGIPPDADSGAGTPMVVRAGDCRKALGGTAAIADGTRAGQAVVSSLLGKAYASGPKSAKILNREQKAQATLARLFDFTADTKGIADDTIICRCEGKTLADLKAIIADADRPSPREVKLNGRFGMGSCQGRFCNEWVAHLMAEDGATPAAPEAFQGLRWPIRPVPISSFLTDAPSAQSVEQTTKRSE